MRRVPILATAAEALAHGCDVFVEYTKPEIAKADLAALAAGAHVVVGTSGSPNPDYAEESTGPHASMGAACLP